VNLKEKGEKLGEEKVSLLQGHYLSSIWNKKHLNFSYPHLINSPEPESSESEVICSCKHNKSHRMTKSNKQLTGMRIREFELLLLEGGAIAN